MSELQPPEERTDVCVICGNRRIDRSENPKSITCQQCREEKLHYPIPKVILIAFVIVIALVCVAMMKVPQSLQMYKTYRDADKRVADGYIASTLFGMSEVLEKYPNSLKISVKATDIAMEHGYYDFAAYYIQTYIEGKSLEDDTYNRLLGYTEKLDRYYAAVNAVEKVFNDAAVLTMTPDDYLTYIQSHLSDLLDNYKYDKALLYYYIGYMEPDSEKRIDYMQKCLSIDSNYLDAIANIASVYRRQGDLATAKSKLEEAYQRNKENSSVLRNLAIIELLEGDYEQGVIYAERSYINYPEGDYTADTYITALYCNGQVELANQVKAECEANNIYLDETLGEFLEGKISLEEYYLD